LRTAQPVDGVYFCLHGAMFAENEHDPEGTVFHTYPHRDEFDTGARAARLLLRILDHEVKPTTARVFIPALARGDELITDTGLLGDFIRRARSLEKNNEALAAAMIIGNPFTDVPDLDGPIPLYLPTVWIPVALTLWS